MIQIIDQRTDLDYCVRLYRRAIYNILVQLHPRICLEIGTHIYQTSKVFSRYFEEHKEENREKQYQLITTDIAECGRSKEPPPRVWPVMVYPHIPNSQDYHGGIEIYHKDWERVIKNDCSERVNTDCILIGLDDMKRKVWCGCECHTNPFIMHYVPCCTHHTKAEDRPFDFAFVDGDHTQISIMRDLRIAKKLVRREGYILIDDIEDPGHEQMNYYQNYLKPKNPSFYEMAGMGLIKAGDLVL